jgi:NAD(P)-dependent dehydrogenase (short-subunit alcohol dehydrogenase family)
MDLDGKVIIVTGGATGIGFGIAKEMVKAGGEVVIASRNDINLKKAKDVLEGLGKTVTVYKADVTSSKQVTEMADAVYEQFGQIDVLVNNAAMITPYTPFTEITEEHWDEVIRTNLTGYFYCTQAIAPYMMKHQYGKIINITSMAALGIVTPGLAPYIVSKVGIIGLTKVCAREFGGFGINVNSIAVGRIHTQMSHTIRTKEQIDNYLEHGIKSAVLGRLGQPEDIANLSVFLASDKSSFITGQIIHCDGGRMDRM